MSSFIQRLDGLDGRWALARCAKKQGQTKVEKLLLTAGCLAALTPAALPSLAKALLWPIEARFERTILADHSGVAGFIALGGGDERVLEAARLARAHPGAKLVITGHGERALQLAHQSGLPPDRILIEPAAQNTFENAQFTAALLGENDSTPWVLVTSASHMPRAIGCFRKANVAIEAWPVDDVSYGWLAGQVGEGNARVVRYARLSAAGPHRCAVSRAAGPPARTGDRDGQCAGRADHQLRRSVPTPRRDSWAGDCDACQA